MAKLEPFDAYFSWEEQPRRFRTDAMTVPLEVLYLEYEPEFRAMRNCPFPPSKGKGLNKQDPMYNLFGRRDRFASGTIDVVYRVEVITDDGLWVPYPSIIINIHDPDYGWGHGFICAEDRIIEPTLLTPDHFFSVQEAKMKGFNIAVMDNLEGALYQNLEKQTNQTKTEHPEIPPEIMAHLMAQQDK